MNDEPANDEDQDWAERAGRRVGRALGFITVPILVFLLARTLGWL